MSTEESAEGFYVATCQAVSALVHDAKLSTDIRSDLVEIA